MWDQINNLRGREKGRKQLSIYGKDGVKLNDEEKGAEIRRYLSGIHKMRENNIGQVWNNEERIKYEEELEQLLREQQRQEQQIG